MPDITITTVLVNGIYNGLYGIDLVGAHNEHFLLALYQHQIAADQLAQGALGQEVIRKVVQMSNLLIALVSVLINGQEALIGIKAEVLFAVIGEIARIVTITDDKQLHEAQQSIGIAVASIVFILNDLFHRPAWADLERLKLNLYQRQTIDQQNDVVPMVAVIRVDTQLVNHFKVVLAPFTDVNEGIFQRRTVFTGEFTLFT